MASCCTFLIQTAALKTECKEPKNKTALEMDSAFSVVTAITVRHPSFKK